MIDTTLSFFLKNIDIYFNMAANGEEINIDLGDGREVKLTQGKVSQNRTAFK